MVLESWNYASFVSENCLKLSRYVAKCVTVFIRWPVGASSLSACLAENVLNFV